MWKALAIAAGALLCAAQSARGQVPIGSMPIPTSAADLAAAAGVQRVDPSTLALDIVRIGFASAKPNAEELKVRGTVARLLDSDGAPSAVLPLPLSSKVWTERVLRRSVAAGRLAGAILEDRRTALLYYGLMGIEPGTLAWIEANPAVLDLLYRNAAVAAVYGRSIRIKDGRVVTPGDRADDVWAGLVGADPRQPAAFLQKLLPARSGRLAGLYDAIAHLDAPHQSFAIGRPDDPDRVARARRLLDAATRFPPRWKIDDYPFMRPDVDVALLLRDIRVTPTGHLAPPAAREVWSQVFGRPAGSGEMDAASVTELILDADDAVARERFQVFLFGQRALGSDAGASDSSLVKTLTAFSRYPALMLTLESHGLDSAGYAAAASAAAALEADEEALLIFQAGLSIVDIARRARTIDASVARVAIASLVAAAGDGSRSRLLDWMRSGLLEPLARAVANGDRLDAEALLLSAMAGPSAPGPVVTWEQQQFRTDLARAERYRLSAIRTRQDETPLDAALAAATPREVTALAHSLAGLVYAYALGEPGGQASESGQVWRRHHLGGNASGQPGRPVAWRIAREEFAADGWRLVGSLLRLDVALAPLALRRLDSTTMPDASRLTTTDRRTLALSVALLDPRSTADAERDALAAALVRGRARAATLSRAPATLDGIADAAGLSEWRRNAARWRLAAHPEGAAELFTLLELFRLGDGEPHAQWGAAATPIDSCLCLRFPERGAWEEFAGRPASGQLATQLPDVVLRAAEALAVRRLPAVLTRDVIAFAMQDVLDRARPAYFDDWLPVAFAARDLREDQFDDYVAALTASGPLVPVRKGGQ